MKRLFRASTYARLRMNNLDLSFLLSQGFISLQYSRTPFPHLKRNYCDKWFSFL